MDSRMLVMQKSTLSSRLNQPISFKKRAVRYPTKTAMNLYGKVVNVQSLTKTIIAVVLIAIIAAALTKFGILDRLDKVAAARAELNGYLQQQSALEAQLADFQQIKENYQRYTNHYQTAEEAALIDRIALLKTLDSDAAGLVEITSVAVSGDSATVTITADELSLVARYKLVLQGSEYVTAADVYNASTLEDQATGVQYVTATIVLTLAQEVAE
jgi:Tfp pilus assembly protein PilN